MDSEFGVLPAYGLYCRHRSKRRRVRSSPAGKPRVFLVFISCPPQAPGSTANDTRRPKEIHARLPKGHGASGSIVCAPAAGISLRFQQLVFPFRNTLRPTLTVRTIGCFPELHGAERYASRLVRTRSIGCCETRLFPQLLEGLTTARAATKLRFLVAPRRGRGGHDHGKDPINVYQHGKGLRTCPSYRVVIS
jgi:hypothetical protein